MANAINWFEIPVKDLDRAQTFYQTLLAAEMQLDASMGYVFFPSNTQSGEIGGALVAAEGYEPAQTGTLAYLNGGEDLAVPLARVEAAGGTVIMPKTAIGPHGFIATFTDTEGNRVALHSMN